MPGSRFDDELFVESPNEIIAAGPVDAIDEVKEICAWVYQRVGDQEAAATEMSTTPEGMAKLTATPRSGRWELRLGRISAADFDVPGRGFAVAVALLQTNGHQRVVWWGQPVDLLNKPGT